MVGCQNPTYWDGATICSCGRSILFLTNGKYDLHLQEHPIIDKLLYLDYVRSVLRFHDKNVFCNCLAHFLCLFQQRVSSFFHVPFQRWDPYCLQMNVFGLHSFQQRSRSSIWRTEFFVKRINIDLLRTGRFSSILHSACVKWVSPFSHDLDLELVGTIGNF